MAIINFRKLPGCTSIYRAGNVPVLSNYDCSSLVNNIGVYLDLRSQGEILNVQQETQNIKYICIDMNNAENSYIIDTPIVQNYVEYYMAFLVTCKKQIAYFFECLSKDEQANILYGCTLGKDRTGIITYLLLSCMNTPFDVSKSDYIKSEEELVNNQVVIDYFKSINKNDFYNRISNLDKIFECFNYQFIKKYGTVYNYLLEIGINEFEQKNIYKKLEKRFR